MKKIALLLFALVAMAGCQQMTTIETTYDKDGHPLKSTELRSDYASYAKANEPPKDRPKLVDVECPPTGCNFTKFAVYDPGTGGGKAAISAPPESLAQSLVHEMFATVRGAIPYAAGAAVLVKAFDKANSSITTTTDNSNRSSSSSSSNTSNTSTSNTTNTTTTNTTTTSDSNNTTRTATGGNTTTGSGGGATTGP